MAFVVSVIVFRTLQHIRIDNPVLTDNPVDRLGWWAPRVSVIVFAVGICLHLSAPSSSVPPRSIRACSTAFFHSAGTLPASGCSPWRISMVILPPRCCS